MATHAHSTTASLILFPTERVGVPLHDGPIYDRASYEHAFVASYVARQFDKAPDATVRAMLESDEGDGHYALARTLEHNRRAISFLRAALANLIAADRRISAAADRVLAEADCLPLD